MMMFVIPYKVLTIKTSAGGQAHNDYENNNQVRCT
jgi:hypothetical protein